MLAVEGVHARLGLRHLLAQGGELLLRDERAGEGVDARVLLVEVVDTSARAVCVRREYVAAVRRARIPSAQPV